MKTENTISKKEMKEVVMEAIDAMRVSVASTFLSVAEAAEHIKPVYIQESFMTPKHILNALERVEGENYEYISVHNIAEYMGVTEDYEFTIIDTLIRSGVDVAVTIKGRSLGETNLVRKEEFYAFCILFMSAYYNN